MPAAVPLPESVSELKALAGTLSAQLAAQDRQLAEQTRQVEAQIAQLKEQAAFIDKLKFEIARLKRWRGLTAEDSLNTASLTGQRSRQRKR